MHIPKYEEWEINGKWYCNDQQELSCKNSVASLWWTPARILKISLVEYIELLINKFNVDYIHYNEENDVLIFYWKSQTKMRVFKNYINKVFRDAGIKC